MCCVDTEACCEAGVRRKLEAELFHWRKAELWVNVLGMFVLDACVYAVRAGKDAEQLIAHRSRGARRVARLRLSILGRLFFREVSTLCANFCTWRSGTQMMTNCLTSFPDYVCDNP